MFKVYEKFWNMEAGEGVLHPYASLKFLFETYDIFVKMLGSTCEKKDDYVVILNDSLGALNDRLGDICHTDNGVIMSSTKTYKSRVFTNNVAFLMYFLSVSGKNDISSYLLLLSRLIDLCERIGYDYITPSMEIIELSYRAFQVKAANIPKTLEYTKMAKFLSEGDFEKRLFICELFSEANGNNKLDIELLLSVFNCIKIEPSNSFVGE